MEQTRGVRNKFMQIWIRCMPMQKGSSGMESQAIHKYARTLGYAHGKM